MSAIPERIPLNGTVRYCAKCGRELVERTSKGGYSKTTGKRIVMTRRVCPRRGFDHTKVYIGRDYVGA